MAKEQKPEKTYSRKVIAKALFPYIIIYTIIVIAGGVVIGWTLRSDFENTVRSEVRTQVKALKV